MTMSLKQAAAFGALGSPTILCVFGSHLFFNLKEAAEYGVNVDTNWSAYSPSLNTMSFNEPQDGEERYVDHASLRSKSDSHDRVVLRRSNDAGTPSAEMSA